MLSFPLLTSINDCSRTELQPLRLFFPIVYEWEKTWCLCCHFCCGLQLRIVPKNRNTILELVVSYNLTKRLYVVIYVIVFCFSLQSGLFEGTNHNPRACSSVQCSNMRELGVFVVIFVEHAIMLNAYLLSRAYG